MEIDSSLAEISGGKSHIYAENEVAQDMGAPDRKGGAWIRIGRTEPMEGTEKENRTIARAIVTGGTGAIGLALIG